MVIQTHIDWRMGERSWSDVVSAREESISCSRSEQQLNWFSSANEEDFAQALPKA